MMLSASPTAAILIHGRPMTAIAAIQVLTWPQPTTPIGAAYGGHRIALPDGRRAVWGGGAEPRLLNRMQWKNLREQSVMTVSRSESIRKFTTIIAVLFVAGTFASDLAQSQEQKAGPMDEKAMQILQGMSDYLAGAKTLSFRARTLFDEVRKSGIKIKSARTIHVVLQRPSSLRVLSIADNGAARTSWFDGSKLTVLMRDTNQFMELEYEGNIDGMLDELIENHEAQLPLADLAYSDIAKNFKENLISAGYLGIKLVNGIKCHHLSFESTGADWQIWIQADATPLPRRFAISYVNDAERPEFLASLSRWSINGKAVDDQFKASIPESAKKVPFGK